MDQQKQANDKSERLQTQGTDEPRLSLLELVGATAIKARLADKDSDGSLDQFELFTASREQATSSKQAQINAALMGAFRTVNNIADFDEAKAVIDGRRQWQNTDYTTLKRWEQRLTVAERLAERAYESSTKDRDEVFGKNGKLGTLSCGEQVSFLAGCLSSIARNHPEKVRNMIQTHSDGTVEVRFPGLKQFVVETSIPTAAEAAAYISSEGNGRWPSVMARAYGQVWKELGGDNQRDGLGTLTNFHPEFNSRAIDTAIELLTGNRADYVQFIGAPGCEPYQKALTTVKQAIDEKRIVVVETALTQPNYGRVLELIDVKHGDGKNASTDSITVYSPGCALTQEKPGMITMNGEEFGNMVHVARFETRKTGKGDDLSNALMMQGTDRQARIKQVNESLNKAKDATAPKASDEPKVATQVHNDARLRFRPSR